VAGRPERPIDPSSPLAPFAAGLRALRKRSGLTYQEMVPSAGWSKTTLSKAANGQDMPSWEVTWSYVRVCGGPVNEWRARWRQARAAKAAGRAGP
jgi:DNA-binding XRE family transcriptional regulator